MEDLREMQELPLEIKIKMSQRRIRDWYNHFSGEVYVSFSGGKDSTVLKHIVEDIYHDVPSIFVNTGLEYPEIRKFATSQNNVEVVKPSMRFDEVVLKYGYPVISKEVAKDVQYARSNQNSIHFKRLFGLMETKEGTRSAYNHDNWSKLYGAPFKISDYCCNVMKKKPARDYKKKTGRKPIVGTLAIESRLRTSTWLRVGCNAFEAKRQVSAPLSFWTEQDILRYLKETGIPYCKGIYGDIVEANIEGQVPGQITILNSELTTTGADRTGCVFCMFGAHLEKHPNRFERLKETHPKLYDYCMGGGCWLDGMWRPNENGLGMDYVLNYLKIKH